MLWNTHYTSDSCDTRSMEEGDLDSGRKVSGQEAMIIFDMFSFHGIYIMNGEFEFVPCLLKGLPVITEEVMFVKQSWRCINRCRCSYCRL